LFFQGLVTLFYNLGAYVLLFVEREKITSKRVLLINKDKQITYKNVLMCQKIIF
jgi:hypothetical protein